VSNEERDDLGAALLAELARDPGSSLVSEFHALFYEFIWKRLWRDRDRLSDRVRRHLGVASPTAPPLRPEEVGEVAHDATTRALRRVGEGASKFDPTRGTATHWVIGASEFAFVEVAKEVAAERRPLDVEFEPPERLNEVLDSEPGIEEVVIARISTEEILAEAADLLSEREWEALRLVVTERYSYAETAEMIFGSADFKKEIDGLLTRAKRKLNEAWSHRRPGSGDEENTKVSDGMTDKEGTNG
jgi:hypothetical protein